MHHFINDLQKSLCGKKSGVVQIVVHWSQGFRAVSPPSTDRWARYAGLRQILRLNVEGAEDLRAQASVDKQRLFPPHRDVEALVDKLQNAGIRSATTAAQWLAYNFTDPQAAADLLASDPGRFGGVLFDAMVDGPRLHAALAALRTEQLAVVARHVRLNEVPQLTLLSRAGISSDRLL